ncbi:hypothetical protein [Antribacter gilvus]|uniref:hypothetical protein n=1 Tax=Antribacter gilvus TaxID=2304675 RepID=UPI000F7923F1|nr:hypothetical protein [Antribacter gilvus]
MLPRLVRLAYALSVVVPLLLAVQVFSVYDQAPGAGATFQVRVGEVTGTPAADGVARVLRDVAEETGAGVGFVVTDVTDPARRTHLYVVPGDPAGVVASRLDRGFDHFGPYLEESYRPFEQLDAVDPRGYYLVWGSRADADRLLDGFRDLGLDGEVAPWVISPGPALASLPHIVSPPLLGAAGTAVLAVLIMIGGGVVASAQAYGVQRLQGRSFATVVGRDLREVGRLVLVTAAASVVAGGAALWFYNRWARLDEVAVFAAAFVGAFLLAGAAAHLVAVRLTFGAPILAAVKGQFSAGWALTGMFALRLAAGILAVSVGFGTLQAGLQVAERAAAQEMWDTARDAVYVRLSGQMGGDDPELDARASAMARQATDDGDAVLVDNLTGSLSLMTTEGPGGAQVDVRADACPTLLVNPAYLDHQVVRSTSGRLTEVEPSQVTVVAPPSCAGFAREAVPAYLEGWREPTDRTGPAVVEQVEAAPGQDHFTYGTLNHAERSPALHDAVVVIVPAGVDVFPESYYLSALTQGRVVFPDAPTAQAYVERFDVTSLVNGIWPAAQYAADQYAQLVSDLRVQALSLAAALLILVVTAVSVSVVHVLRSAQTVYARYLGGWPWWRSHWVVLVVEAGIVAVVVVQGAPLVFDPGTAALGQAQGLRGGAAFWQAATAGIVAVVAVVTVLISLRTATARLVATRSADS